MKKRDFIKMGGFAGLALGFSSQSQAMDEAAACTKETGFLLVHGSWHGAWAWTPVMHHLNVAGYQTLAIDLPGHGFDTILPDSFTSRPLDKAAFAREPSSLASYSIADYEAAVLDGARKAQTAGIKRLIAVGHSMGGVPLTFAASRASELFAGLVYLAALTPTKGKPAGAYLQLKDQAENSQLSAALMADPAVVGALRIDPRSQDEDYLNRFKAALAADVDDKLLGAVTHLLTPDAPVSLYNESLTLSSGYGDLPKRFIRAIHDNALLPSTAQAIVKDVNDNWPHHRCDMIDIATFREVMFANPRLLSNLLIEAAKG